MNFEINPYRAASVMCVVLASAFSVNAFADDRQRVIVPPDTFFEKVRDRDRAVARKFYTKYLDVGGLPVVAAEVVEDAALFRTHEMVSAMLAGRPDVLNEMVSSGMYLIIIGKGQVYTDMPENRNVRNPEYFNERVRGTGGKPTSFGEENLLSLPVDRYDDESIAVHEFAHTIDFSLRRLDPGWNGVLDAAYEAAMEKGLFKDTYAASNKEEYWAEAVQTFFGCNRVDNWNHGPIGTREQLQVYDPGGYELVRKVFNLGVGQDWSYKWLQELPNVEAPPSAFGYDPFYTKFSYARELPVLGRGVDDEVLLEANHIIRRMFAYRHDILKEMISRGGRVVVLGEGESISGLPELADPIAEGVIDPLIGSLDFHEPSGLMVVSGRGVMGDGAVDHPLLSVLARAIVNVAGARAIDPEFEGRRDVQQYELRVKRIDREFVERLELVFAGAVESGLWRGTSAMHDATRYWTRGVLCYFDAAGPDAAPHDWDHPVASREQLEAYDAELYALVAETMAFKGKSDWRFRAATPGAVKRP